MKLPPVLAVICFLPFAAVSGCISFERAKFNPPRGLGGHRTLLVPFASPKDFRGYGESEKGRIVTQSLKRWAIEEHGARFANDSRAALALEQARDLDWKEKGKDARAWAGLVADVDCRWVLTGEIRKIERAPEVIGIAEYTVTASYRVVDVRRAMIVFSRNDREVQIGNPEDREILVVTPGMKSDEYAQGRVLAKLGQEIGKELYGYYDD